ncbi:unnamed protein product [Gadus morhua 'NCC']
MPLKYTFPTGGMRLWRTFSVLPVPQPPGRNDRCCMMCLTPLTSDTSLSIYPELPDWTSLSLLNTIKTRGYTPSGDVQEHYDPADWLKEAPPPPPPPPPKVRVRSEESDGLDAGV